MFGRRKSSKSNDSNESIHLDLLITYLGQATGTWESMPKDQVFVQARLADCCRDAEVMPVSGTNFSNAWNQFDGEHQWRFCLLLAPLELPTMHSRIKQTCHAAGNGQPVLQRLQKLTTDHALLTGSVLQQSDVRLEELARHFCAEWKLSIVGETAEASAARRQQIDFRRLMTEADAARASAEDRLAYLRQLQEEEEKTRRPRRGKW